MNRRTFLKSSGLSVIAFGAIGTPLFLTRTAASTIEKSFSRKKILVTIFQRGAMDGLMAVTPFSDSNFAKARPRLAMQPGKGKGQLIDLDGTYGLHPSFTALERLYREQRLAIVHGMGSPNTTRSHFDAQDYMETGTPDRKGTPSGWLNRASEILHNKTSNTKISNTIPSKADTTPFSAVAMTSAMPRSLYGNAPALAIARLDDFGVKVGGGNSTAAMALSNTSSKGFESLYEQTAQKILRGTGQDSFDAMKILSEANLKNYTPSKGVNYPTSPLGDSMKQIAQLIKANVGLEIAFAESGGWDTHVQQGTTNGAFSRRAQDLAEAIEAFWRDIEPHHDDVMLMTMTEFGRTVRENGSGGTDHGRASCLFVLGNTIDGGKVHGSVPLLLPENLADGRDVPVTTDFRAIFTEVSASHLGITDSAKLFPGWSGERIALVKR